MAASDLSSRLSKLEKNVETLQSELQKVKDIQAVQALLNHYTAIHDEACYDLQKRQEWENLFAEDSIAIMPYGQHRGREGMGAWAYQGVEYFELCQLLSSNFDITFTDDRQRAHVRTNCIAQWMKKREKIDEHFDEGGFYHWTLTKKDGEWKIEKVHLTITWRTGEDITGIGGPKTSKL